MARVFYDIKSGVPGVRLATPADEGELFAMLLMLHAENGMFSLNPTKVIQGIRWATERKGGVIFVIEENNRIVASLGMTIAQDWYSDDEYLLERWNYVHPDYRRGDYGRRLLEQGKWSSEWFRVNSKIAMPFQCGITSFDRTEAKIRLYARHMPCVGANFIWGDLPLPWKKERAKEAIREIKEHRMNDRRDVKKSGEKQEVVSTVETILRLSREREHVWKV